MRRTICSLLLFAMCFGLAACASNEKDGMTTTVSGTDAANASESTTAAPEPEVKLPLSKDKSYRVLFVGNSYTIRNNLTDIFKNIAVSAGYDVTVDKVLKGAYTLLKFADENDEYGAQVKTALDSNKYDFVVIQGQSYMPISDPGSFYDGVRAMNEKIKANGATPILYETWGRKTGHSVLTQYGWTNETMTWKLAGAYEAIGKELGIDVAYAGLAFYDLYTGTNIELYHSDKTHPSYNGSYTAAMTIFAEIFGVRPTEINYTEGLSGDNAADLIRAAAEKAVFDTPEISQEYKTASEGVHSAKISIMVDSSNMVNLTSMPASSLVSVLTGTQYTNGCTGILGTKGQVCSAEYSTTSLTDAQKADIADIGYGLSMIGIESMNTSTALANLVNGHWGSGLMCNLTFDDNKYDIDGKVNADGKYTALITLNFGSRHSFDAIGFFSGNLEGFPGAAEVYVSDDGVNWTVVPTACWDQINGEDLVSCGTSPEDPYTGSGTAKTSCFFGMNGATGQYIRVGIAVGRNDSTDKYNTINTRELAVYGSKIS